MTTLDKVNKAKYGKVVAFKFGNGIYKFRPPTCEELVKYQRMNEIDVPAAKYYLLSSCSIDDIKIETIPPQIIEKVEQFFEKEATMLSLDGYQQTKLNLKEIPPMIMLIYNFGLMYNISIDYLLSLTPSELMQMIVIIEQLTNTLFINTNAQDKPFANQEEYNKQIGDAFNIATQRIKNMQNKK